MLVLLSADHSSQWCMCVVLYDFYSILSPGDYKCIHVVFLATFSDIAFFLELKEKGLTPKSPSWLLHAGLEFTVSHF